MRPAISGTVMVVCSPSLRSMEVTSAAAGVTGFYDSRRVARLAYGVVKDLHGHLDAADLERMHLRKKKISGKIRRRWRKFSERPLPYLRAEISASRAFTARSSV